MSRFQSRHSAFSRRLCREKGRWNVALLDSTQRRMMNRLCHGLRWNPKQSKCVIIFCFKVIKALIPSFLFKGMAGDNVQTICHLFGSRDQCGWPQLQRREPSEPDHDRVAQCFRLAGNLDRLAGCCRSALKRPIPANDRPRQCRSSCWRSV